MGCGRRRGGPKAKPRTRTVRPGRTRATPVGKVGDTRTTRVRAPAGLAAGASTAASERELDAFRQREGHDLNAEIARLRRKLRDKETEAQKSAKKNREDMERLVRRLTEEHLRDLWTKRFQTTSPFVSELPSSVIRDSSRSASAASPSSSAAPPTSVGRRASASPGSGTRGESTQGSAEASDSEQDDEVAGERNTAEGGGEPPDSGGGESSDHDAGEASDHGGDEGKEDDSESTEKAEPREHTGGKAGSADSTVMDEASAVGGRAEGPVLMGVEVPKASAPPAGASRPRVSRRIVDSASEAGVSSRVVDSATRHAGEKREPEPVPVRSDDVTVARLLSNMTSSILRAQDSAKQPSPRPKCRMVESITDEAKLASWRDHRQRYLRELRIYNKVPGNVPVEPDPVISKITREQRRAISEWLLRPQHRTKSGEDPNLVECANWVLGTGLYDVPVNRVKCTQAGMIKSVKWPRLTQGVSHRDRFFAFSAKMGDTIRKIPEEQMTRSVKKAQVRHMCGQLKPSRLWRLVNNAVEAGQDDRPSTGRVYNST